MREKDAGDGTVARVAILGSRGIGQGGGREVGEIGGGKGGFEGGRGKVALIL